MFPPLTSSLLCSRVWLDHRKYCHHVAKLRLEHWSSAYNFTLLLQSLAVQSLTRQSTGTWVQHSIWLSRWHCLFIPKRQNGFQVQNIQHFPPLQCRGLSSRSRAFISQHAISITPQCFIQCEGRRWDRNTRCFIRRNTTLRKLSVMGWATGSFPLAPLISQGLGGKWPHTACPEKLLMPYHWKCSRSDWMELWATWFI